ncbi:lipopolysaccharide biosynthesis protein [Nocardioides gansuensis]|uniref:lipopolysaccharide biosynthesis protein n=1 Tax=Nocardioides gansuensis TaxID=2138300 RepID=UPI001402E0FE|nr:oligosaccharide flippase family protein [Nocardioides gansuensis]
MAGARVLGRVRGGLAHPAAAVVRGSLVAQLALLVSGPVVLRLLGVTDRGELALVWAVVLLACQVGVLGLPAAVTWYVARRGLRPADLLTRLQARFAGQVAAVSALTAAAVLGVNLLGPPLGRPWLLAGVAGLGAGAAMVALVGLAALQGAQRYRLLAWLQPVPAVSYAVAVCLLALAGVGSVPLLLALNLAGWGLVAVVSVAAARRLPAAEPDGVLPDVAEVVAYGRRSLVATAAPIDTLGLEQILLGLVAGHHALGLFTVGWAFETGPVVVLVALAGYAGSRVSTLERPGPFVRRWLLRGLAVGVAACVAIELMLEPVLLWAFGQEAAPAVPLARVLVVAGVVLGLRRLSAAILVGLGKARAASWCELAGLATMLAGMLMLLLPRWTIAAPGVVLLMAGAVALCGQLVVLGRALSPAPGALEQRGEE